MHGMHQPAARHRQPVLLVQERRDLPKRKAELFIEDDGERDHLGAELRARGAERIRRLQRVTALHAPTAGAARANVNPKLADHDARDGEFLLILSGNPCLSHRAAAGWATARRVARQCGAAVAGAPSPHTAPPLFGPAAADAA